MTRTRRHPGTRPPGRQDTRRPGSTPPRTPGTGTPARPPGGSPAPGDAATSPTLPAGLPTTAPTTGRPSTTPSTGRPSTPGNPSRPYATPGPYATPATGDPSAARTTGHPSAARPAGHTRTAGTTGSPSAAPAGSRAPATARGGARPLGATSTEAPRPPAPQPRPTDVFAERLLAVLSGARPVHCMLRHTAGRAYDELAWLAERGPLRTRGTRPVVRDIGYYVARPGAVEAFARIGAGDQLRAMAFRLEQGPDLRWRCTAIELGGPRMPRPND
ncbi:Rv3235 family protein [Streptomyces sp. NBC_00638]|nr:Rv3235 family protein [Streptomyces sp. NBC_00638]